MSVCCASEIDPWLSCRPGGGFHCHNSDASLSTGISAGLDEHTHGSNISYYIYASFRVFLDANVSSSTDPSDWVLLSDCHSHGMVSLGNVDYMFHAMYKSIMAHQFTILSAKHIHSTTAKLGLLNLRAQNAVI